MLTGKELRRWISGAYVRAQSVIFVLSAALVLLIVVTPLAQAQNFSILYGFGRNADGRSPQAGLFWNPGGGLYGTTFLGGSLSCSCGTVFKLFPNGDFTVVHTFTGADGANPAAVLIADPKGNLYEPHPKAVWAANRRNGVQIGPASNARWFLDRNCPLYF